MNHLKFSISCSLIVSLLLIFSVKNFAQPFDKAPVLKKKVHQIIEWSRPNMKTDSKRGGTSIFDKNGKLMMYYVGKDSADLQTYRYDKKGRLIERLENSGDRLTQHLTVYKSNSIVREQKFHSRIEKTFEFYKKGKLVELKGFVKGEELGNKLVLKDRVVFNYNSKDSLVGEMHYAYPMRSKRKPQKRKVLHKYEGPDGRKSSAIHYDFDGNLRMRIDYTYWKGKISKIDYLYPEEGPSHSLTYLYKGGKIWQKIEESDFRKHVDIYVDGRLIRSRSYQDGKLFKVIDFQYLYY